jgi:hypothetical protein
VGAIALSSSTPRWSSNVDEPEREPVRADKSTPVAALLRFALTSAYPSPMRNERIAAAAGTPMAPWRSRIFASAEAAPQQFLRALIAANPLQLRSLPPTRLALAALPGLTLDPQSYTSPAVRRETPDYSRLAYYAYSEVQPTEKPADTVLQALQDIPEGTPVEEVQRAARIFGLDVIFMEAVVKIESNFDPKQRTGSYVGLFQLSKYEFDRYGSGDITDARANAIAGVYKFAVAAILFELATHEKATLPYLYI